MRIFKILVPVFTMVLITGCTVFVNFGNNLKYKNQDNTKIQQEDIDNSSETSSGDSSFDESIKIDDSTIYPK
jgi:lipopolysaccharide export LptBFGC system permease protein LptF